MHIKRLGMQSQWMMMKINTKPFNQGLRQYAGTPEFGNGVITSGEVKKCRPTNCPMPKVGFWGEYRPAFYSKHRRSWESHYKTKIPDGYHIHHKDGDKKNNNPVNLLCCPLDVHIEIHELNGDCAVVKLLRNFSKSEQENVYQ